MEKIIVSVEDANIRIDKYLVDKLDIPRSQIQKLVENKKILINGQNVKNKYKVQTDDVVEIGDISEEPLEIKPEKMDLDIVYEDEYLLIVNKPTGMVVHPAPGHYSNTLVNGLMYYSDSLSNVNGEFRPGIVHRIDKNTSGLLIVAKNNETHNKLAEMIKEREVHRYYKALVHGEISEESAMIKAPIGRDPLDRKRMTVTDKNSKDAQTNIRVLERVPNYTFIECSLLSGRTHQIRVHMKYIGYPLVGDPEYGPKKTIDVDGQALHAYKIEFIHPMTGENIKIEIDLPVKYQEVLKKLNFKG